MLIQELAVMFSMAYRYISIVTNRNLRLLIFSEKICVKNKAWEIFVYLEFVFKSISINEPSGFFYAKKFLAEHSNKAF
jgi:hypothetical protein